MKKFKQIALMACTLSMMAFVACKSTPEAQPAPVPDTPVEAPEEKPEEPQEEKDFSESNKALFETVTASRQEAIDSGAAVSAEAAFKLVEAEYEAIKAAMENSTGDMSKALEDLNNRYSALTLYSTAKKSKDRIEELNFASYDQASYDEGNAILESLSDPATLVAFGSTWNKKAVQAKTAFDKVLDAGFRALAKEERTEAFKAKKLADEVKASVSRKAEYDAAVADFTSGDSKYVTKDPEGALESYKKSNVIFAKLYEEISVAREKALAAVEAAKKRVALSENTASEADESAPLTQEDVEGIEDEDTQLLEADDFTSAENSVVEVSEEIKEIPEEDNFSSEAEKSVEEIIEEAAVEVIENAAADAVNAIINSNNTVEAK